MKPANTQRTLQSAVRMQAHPIVRPLLQARWAVLPAALLPLAAMANPTGGTVVAGEASITAGAGLTTIQQQTASAVINWQQFGIGNGETVNFIQPSASAAILNRVIGGNASEILGNLTSNGRVFLINPQGVMFGAGARVDVGSLVASTLDIRNEDFMAGRYVLASSANPAGVSNDGVITAREGGFVVLSGGDVRNGGLIQTRLGDVVLASGAGLTLDMNDTGLISYRIDAAALSDVAGVVNTGSLMADGGRVFMSAHVARSLAATAVNNSGQVRATRIGEQNGVIVLEAQGGNTVSSGTLTATNDHGTGGSIQVLGNQDVLVTAGTVDASGTTGGGVIRVGGGWQGGEGVQTAQRTALGQDAVLRADATESGQGGNIVVWSDHNTVALGTISVRGAGSGRGGDVETSSHGYLAVARAPEIAGGLLSGTQGGGSWLIDPYDLTIVGGLGTGTNQSGTVGNQTFTANQNGSTVSASSILTALQSSGTVTITTVNPNGAQDGDLTVDAELNYQGLTGNGTLNLIAADDIVINQSIYNGNTNVTNNTLTLNLQSGVTSGSGNIDVNALVSTNGGSFSANSQGGDINLGAAVNTVNAANNTLRGALSAVTSGGNVVVNGNLTAANTTLSATGGSINLVAAANSNGLALNTEALTLRADKGMNDGTKPVQISASSVSTLGSNGALVLDDTAITVSGTGNVTLDTQGGGLKISKIIANTGTVTLSSGDKADLIVANQIQLGGGNTSGSLVVNTPGSAALTSVLSNNSGTNSFQNISLTVGGNLSSVFEGNNGSTLFAGNLTANVGGDFFTNVGTANGTVNLSSTQGTNGLADLFVFGNIDITAQNNLTLGNIQTFSNASHTTALRSENGDISTLRVGTDNFTATTGTGNIVLQQVGIGGDMNICTGYAADCKTPIAGGGGNITSGRLGTSTGAIVVRAGNGSLLVSSSDSSFAPIQGFKGVTLEAGADITVVNPIEQRSGNVTARGGFVSIAAGGDVTLNQVTATRENAVRYTTGSEPEPVLGSIEIAAGGNLVAGNLSATATTVPYTTPFGNSTGRDRLYGTDAHIIATAGGTLTVGNVSAYADNKNDTRLYAQDLSAAGITLIANGGALNAGNISAYAAFDGQAVVMGGAGIHLQASPDAKGNADIDVGSLRSDTVFSTSPANAGPRYNTSLAMNNGTVNAGQVRVVVTEQTTGPDLLSGNINVNGGIIASTGFSDTGGRRQAIFSPEGGILLDTARGDININGLSDFLTEALFNGGTLLASPDITLRAQAGRINLANNTRGALGYYARAGNIDLTASDGINLIANPQSSAQPVFFRAININATATNGSVLMENGDLGAALNATVSATNGSILLTNIEAQPTAAGQTGTVTLVTNGSGAGSINVGSVRAGDAVTGALGSLIARTGPLDANGNYIGGSGSNAPSTSGTDINIGATHVRNGIRITNALGNISIGAFDYSSSQAADVILRASNIVSLAPPLGDIKITNGRLIVSSGGTRATDAQGNVVPGNANGLDFNGTQIEASNILLDSTQSGIAGDTRSYVGGGLFVGGALTVYGDANGPGSLSLTGQQVTLGTVNTTTFDRFSIQSTETITALASQTGTTFFTPSVATTLTANEILISGNQGGEGSLTLGSPDAAFNLSATTGGVLLNAGDGLLQVNGGITTNQNLTSLFGQSVQVAGAIVTGELLAGSNVSASSAPFLVDGFIELGDITVSSPLSLAAGGYLAVGALAANGSVTLESGSADFNAFLSTGSVSIGAGNLTINNRGDGLTSTGAHSGGLQTVDIDAGGLLRINEGQTFTLTAERIALSAGFDTFSPIETGPSGDFTTFVVTPSSTLAIDAGGMSLVTTQGNVVVTAAGSILLGDVITRNTATLAQGGDASQTFTAGGGLMLGALDAASTDADGTHTALAAITATAGGQISTGSITTLAQGGVSSHADAHVTLSRTANQGFAAAAFVAEPAPLLGTTISTGQISTTATGAESADASVKARADAGGDVHLGGVVTTQAIATPLIDARTLTANAAVDVFTNSGSVLTGAITTEAIAGDAAAPSAAVATANALISLVSGSSTQGPVSIQTGALSATAAAYGSTTGNGTATASVTLDTEGNFNPDQAEGANPMGNGNTVSVFGPITTATSNSNTGVQASSGAFFSSVYGGDLALNGPISVAGHVNLRTLSMDVLDPSGESTSLVSGDLVLRGTESGLSLLDAGAFDVSLVSQSDIVLSTVQGAEVSIGAIGDVIAENATTGVSITSTEGLLYLAARNVIGENITLDSAGRLTLANTTLDTRQRVAEGGFTGVRGSVTLIAAEGTAAFDAAPAETPITGVVTFNSGGAAFSTANLIADHLALTAHTIDSDQGITQSGDLTLSTTVGGIRSGVLVAGRDLLLTSAQNVSGTVLAAGGALTVTAPGSLIASGINGGTVTLTASDISSSGPLQLSSTSGDITLNTASVSGTPDGESDTVVINSTGAVNGAGVAVDGGTGNVVVYANNGGNIVVGEVSGGQITIGERLLSDGSAEVGDITLTSASLTQANGIASVRSEGGNITLGTLGADDDLAGLTAELTAATGAVDISTINRSFAALDIISNAGFGTHLSDALRDATLTGTDLTLSTTSDGPVSFESLTVRTLDFSGGSQTHFDFIRASGSVQLESTGTIDIGQVQASGITLQGGAFTGGRYASIGSGTLTGNASRVDVSALTAAAGINLVVDGPVKIIESTFASTGGIALSSGGDMTLGSVTAENGGDVTLDAADQNLTVVDVTGGVVKITADTVFGKAGSPLVVIGSSDIVFDIGTLNAPQSVVITTENGGIDLSGSNLIVGSEGSSATLQAAGNITLGDVDAPILIDISSGGLLTVGNVGSLIGTPQRLTLEGSAGIVFTGASLADTDLTATDVSLSVAGNSLLTLGDLDTRSLSLTTGSGLLSLGHITATSALSIDSAGPVQALSLQGSTVTVDTSGVFSSTGDLTVTSTTGPLSLTALRVEASNLTLDSATTIVRSAPLVVSGSTVLLAQSGELSLDGISTVDLSATGPVIVASSAVAVTGTLTLDADSTLTAPSLSGDSGVVIVSSTLTTNAITARNGRIDLGGSTLLSTGDVVLSSGTGITGSGLLSSTGALNIRSNGAITLGTLTASSVVVDAASGNVKVDAVTPTDEAASAQLYARNGSLTVSDLNGALGTLVLQGTQGITFNADADTLLGTALSLTVQNDATLNLGDFTTQSFTLTAGTGSSTMLGNITALQNLTVDSSGSVLASSLTGGGDVVVSGTTLDLGSVSTVNGSITLTGSTTRLNSASGNGITIHAPVLLGSDGALSLISTAGLTLDTPQITAESVLISSMGRSGFAYEGNIKGLSGDITVQTLAPPNGAGSSSVMALSGSYTAARDVTLSAATGSDVVLSDATVTSGRTSTVLGRNVTLTTDSLISGGDVRIDAVQQVLLDNSRIEGNLAYLTADTIRTTEAVGIDVAALSAVGGVLDFSAANIVVGEGIAPLSTSFGLVDEIIAQDYNVAPLTMKPNAFFNASEALMLPSLSGTAHFVVLRAPVASMADLGSISSEAADLFLQFAPTDDAVGGRFDFDVAQLDFARSVATFAFGSSTYGGAIYITDPTTGTVQTANKAATEGRPSNYITFSQDFTYGAPALRDAVAGQVVVLGPEPVVMPPSPPPTPPSPPPTPPSPPPTPPSPPPAPPSPPPTPPSPPPAPAPVPAPSPAPTPMAQGPDQLTVLLEDQLAPSQAKDEEGGQDALVSTETALQGDAFITRDSAKEASQQCDAL